MGIFDFLKRKQSNKAADSPLSYLISPVAAWDGEPFSVELPATFTAARFELMRQIDGKRKNFWALLRQEKDDKGKARVGVYVRRLRIGNITPSMISAGENSELAKRAVFEAGLNACVARIDNHAYAEDGMIYGEVPVRLFFGEYKYTPRLV